MVSTATKSNLLGLKSSVAGLAHSKATASNYLNPKTFLTSEARYDVHTEKVLERARESNKKSDNKLKLYASGPPTAVRRQQTVKRFSKEGLLEAARELNVIKGYDPDYGLEAFLPQPKPIQKYWASEVAEKESAFKTLRKSPKSHRTALFTQSQSTNHLGCIHQPTASQQESRARLRELEATTLTANDKASIKRKASLASLECKVKTQNKLKSRLCQTAEKVTRTNLHSKRHFNDRVVLTVKSPKSKL
jgi:hypothetical protein